MLKPCTECGKKVSTNAIASPHCGNQPKDNCKTCMEHQILDADGNPACSSLHGSCPAYVYDDPCNVKLMKKLHRKTPYDNNGK